MGRSQRLLWRFSICWGKAGWPARWLPRQVSQIGCPPSLHDVATKLGIRVVEHQDELMAADVDLVVSYMCRSLVTERTRARGKYALNFHAGPLPEFGGWAFYNVAILRVLPSMVVPAILWTMGLIPALS